MSHLKSSLGILSKIAEATQVRVERERKSYSTSRRNEILGMEPSATEAEIRSSFLAEKGKAVIAEVKLASPSQGEIAEGMDPVLVADTYLRNGATALSILTEPDFFKGEITYLRRVRETFPESKLLMKDFFIDPVQLYQAKAAGANFFLVIMALLERGFAADLIDQGQSMGLIPLVEVHNFEELEEALSLDARWVGVNNRNLKTMKIDLNTSLSLIRHLPQEVIAISESGLSRAADIQRLKDAGFGGYLIGTSLMVTGDPGTALADLLKGIS